MTETKTAVERLDALLGGLEDGVLRTGAVDRGDLGKAGSREGVEAIRSDIDALIRSRSDRSAGREPGRSVGVQTLGAKAKVTAAMARLGRWVGVGPHAGDETAVPRVRMAFSGARSEKREKDEKDERGDARRRKGMPDDETGKGGG